MKFPLPAIRCGASFAVAVSLLLVPLRAQRPAPTQPAPAVKTSTPQTTAAADRSPSVTFDTLLSADAYGIYAEMRMLGQQASSDEIAQLLAAFGLEGSGASAEFLALYKFLGSHADALMTSRLMFATMPARAGAPETLVAVEMPSVEEARKFVPELRRFVAANIEPPNAAPQPTATTNAGATRDPSRSTARRGRRGARAESDAARAKQPAVPPFQIKRAGNLIAMSNANFTFKDLHGTNQALLVNEPGFQAARTRFSADTLFVYFNTVRMTNSEKQRMEAFEKEYRRQEELAQAEAQRRGSLPDSDIIVEEANSDISAGSANSNMRAGANMNTSVTINGNANTANMNVATTPEDETLSAPSPEATPAPKSEKELEEERRREQSRQFVRSLGSLVFDGQVGSGESWPESIGVGASLEGDALVVRGLFISETADQPLHPIPFLPVLLSGPSIMAEAPAVLPADTDIFLSVSLDLPQMYDYLASLMKIADLVPTPQEDGNAKGKFGEQLAAFEKTNNFRIREELIAALGNEIAIGMPGSGFFGARAVMRHGNSSSPPSGPIVVIALSDKESLQKLLPRVLSSIGLAGATKQSIVEKHGQVEVLAFSGGTLAFIDRFLVGAPDAASMRRVIDAYNNGETLANNAPFRDSTRWQSGQAIGQVYIANAMLKGMFGEVTRSAEDVDDPAIRAYLMRLDPEPGAVTHRATRESNGLMHELRVPKNLLSLLTASSLVGQKLSTMRNNEFMAQWKLNLIHRAQEKHKEKTGRYGTLEELLAGGYIEDHLQIRSDSNEDYKPLETEGYAIKVSASGDKFEATATPTGYPKLGRRSYYVDQTGSIRGGDTGGKPASVSAPIIE
ncbi:MAG TPA: hypothetical protein VEX70_00795 [Pyrinomonadaceae bacterium]|nr:hypothetical protein [Pyrinomonadaceae bacterium]